MTDTDCGAYIHVVVHMAVYSHARLAYRHVLHTIPDVRRDLHICMHLKKCARQ